MDYELSMNCTGMGAPVQFEGTLNVNGTTYWFYFRARGELWRLTFADTLDAAIDGDPAQWSHAETYGTTPYEASTMDLAEAEACIRKGAAMFARGEVWPDALALTVWLPSGYFGAEVVPVGGTVQMLSDPTPRAVVGHWRSDFPHRNPMSGLYYQIERRSQS